MSMGNWPSRTSDNLGLILPGFGVIFGKFHVNFWISRMSRGWIWGGCPHFWVKIGIAHLGGGGGGYVRFLHSSEAFITSP